jgi:hypothetical protein
MIAKLSPPAVALRIAAIAALLVTFVVAFFMPIYTDEVTWKWFQSRLFHDGFVNISLFPQCGATFTTTPLWFMVPLRTVEAWVYGDLTNPLWLRFLGIATCLVWIGIMLAMLRGALGVRLSDLTLAGTVAGFLGLGVLPMLLVINRPEQVLLIGLTVVFLLPFLQPDRTTASREALTLAGVLCLVVLLFTEHAKALLFLPLIAAALFLVARRWWVQIPGVLLLSYFAGASYRYWQTSQSCPGDPAFAQAIKTQFLQLSLLTSHPIAFLQQAAANLLQSRSYVANIRFKDPFWVDWLPPHMVPAPVDQLVNIGVMAFFAVLIVVTAFNVMVLVRKDWNAGAVSRRLLMVASALASLLALAAFQRLKFFYESTLVLPLLGLIAAVAMPGYWWQKAPARGRSLATVLIGLALVSQTVLWVFLVPQVDRDLSRGGYLDKQVTSFSAMDYGRQRTEVLNTARRCGIHPEDRPRHLVLDDLTYTAFIDSYQPFHIPHVNRGGSELFGRLPTDHMVKLLREWRSAGIVAACRLIPAELHPVANGPYCCVRSFAPETEVVR